MAVTKRKSTDVSKPGDARTRRTRERIDAAFVALLHRRAYDGIRVSDVARKSGVGRATFYAHYPDKDALLRSQLDRFVAPLLSATEDPAAFVDATRLFAHLRQVPELYRALMGGTGRRVVEKSLEARLASLLEARAADLDQLPRVPAPIVARVVASSLVGLVSFWTEHAEAPAAPAMQEMFRQLSPDALGARADAATAPSAPRSGR